MKFSNLFSCLAFRILAVNPALNELLWALDFPLNTAKHTPCRHRRKLRRLLRRLSRRSSGQGAFASSFTSEAAQESRGSSAGSPSALEAREKVFNDFRSQNAFIKQALLSGVTAGFSCRIRI